MILLMIAFHGPFPSNDARGSWPLASLTMILRVNRLIFFFEFQKEVEGFCARLRVS